MLHGVIQIAGVRNSDEARMLADAGVDWLGFPLRLAVHQPDLTEEQAATVIAGLPMSVTPVLITYLEQARRILDFCRYLGVDHIQLHGSISLAELEALRKAAPELFVLKSLIVRGNNTAELLRDAAAFEPWVDAFITDTYDPTTGACGATGRTHDWTVSRELVAASRVPVILAGGLTPANVRQAIRKVNPAGVDVHSGVEDGQGRKDRTLVGGFVTAAKAGFDEAASTQGAV